MPRRALWLVAILAIPFAAYPAAAAMVSKSMLIEACTSTKPARKNNCVGYIAGVADTVDSVRDRVCIPEGTKFEFLRVRVTSLLQRPPNADGAAAPAVVAALRHLYPCNR